MNTEIRNTAEDLLYNIPDENLRFELISGLDACDKDKVLGFHKLYKCPIADSTDDNLSQMSDDRIALRFNLMIEELKEVLEEGIGYYMPDFDVTPDMIRKSRESGWMNVSQIAKELADLKYVVEGFYIEMGIDSDKVFSEVHCSNMTKLSEEGEPIFRSDGKVLKGPFYKKPEINIKKVSL